MVNNHFKPVDLRLEIRAITCVMTSVKTLSVAGFEDVARDKSGSGFYNLVSDRITDELTDRAKSEFAH